VTQIPKPLFCPRCYSIEPLLRDPHNNNTRLVSQYQQFRILPLTQPSTSWVAVSVSFVSPFNLRCKQSSLWARLHIQSVTSSNCSRQLDAESNGRLESSDIDFLSACCFGKLFSVDAHVIALPCPVSRPSSAKPEPNTSTGHGGGRSTVPREGPSGNLPPATVHTPPLHTPSMSLIDTPRQASISPTPEGHSGPGIHLHPSSSPRPNPAAMPPASGQTPEVFGSWIIMYHGCDLSVRP
jgi:hypothetical protein